MSLMIPLRNKLLLFSLLFFGSLTNSHVFAEDADPAQTAYIPLTPSFVVNYVGEDNKLSYIKADISLRTSEGQRAVIEANMPLVKDALVMFLELSHQCPSHWRNRKGSNQSRWCRCSK